MKNTDLKREHFPNGQTFTQAMLDAYMAARSKARKDFITRYLLSLLAGFVAGFVVLAVWHTGTVRVFIALLLVIAGAYVGTRLTNDSIDELKKQSRRMILTKKDMRIARKNLRNGTVAWTETREKIAE